ncbi:hypothetical protein LXL04_037839 [Taraxacum kok-saghyz]
MLIAVTKDANNNILPVAYAIVDEETTHSWCWFFYQFRHFVAEDGQLCVISDRHKGIIHAMENLDEWKEPFAYHRFCLRHVRSNLMKSYKNSLNNEGVYRIVTKLQRSETGGNTHIVQYFQHSCTCGKWQMKRFPCSHALAVCRHRGDNPISIVNFVYYTDTYRKQYQYAFTPLLHVEYWLEADWVIEAD